MAYLVDQQIGKHVYVYEVTGYWDPQKKQTRQKRKYLGKRDPRTGEISTPRKTLHPRSARDFGAIWLLRRVAKESGLLETLHHVFPEEGNDLFSLAAYQVCEARPLYLYRDWLESTAMEGASPFSSQELSRFLVELGRQDRRREHFIRRWMECQSPSRYLLFDITSLSSYGRINDCEWGYNRDGEGLPQVNLGILMAEPNGLPLDYRFYPGSIADVSTLKNLLQEMAGLGCEAAGLILDRGFYSAANLQRMGEEGFRFLIPLPMGTSLASSLLTSSKSALHSPRSSFDFQGHTLFASSSAVPLNREGCWAHVYLDLGRKASETERLLLRVHQLEREVKAASFSTPGQVWKEVSQHCPGLEKLFRVRMQEGKAVLEEKEKALARRINRLSVLILLVSDPGLEKTEALLLYRRRDQIEKIFDALKNELQNGRLRVHSREAMEGRFFLSFLSLILYSALLHRLRESGLLEKWAVPEVMAELKKLRLVEMGSGKTFLTEISKKQRTLYEKLGYGQPEEPCY